MENRQRRSSAAPLLVLALSLSSCGSLPPAPLVWEHPSKPSVIIWLDIGLCAREAWQKYPKEEGWVQDGDGYTSSPRLATTDCTTYKNRTTCTHTPAEPARYVPPAMVKGDKNQADRQKAIANCVAVTDQQYKCVRLLGDTKQAASGCASTIRVSKLFSGGVNVGESPTSTLYTYPPFNRREGDIAKAVVIFNWKTPSFLGDGRSYMSTASIMEINCKNSAFRVLVESLYSEEMASGDYLGFRYNAETEPFNSMRPDNPLKRVGCE